MLNLRGCNRITEARVEALAQDYPHIEIYIWDCCKSIFRFKVSVAEPIGGDLRMAS
jgi:hypothetical protein